MIERAMLAAAIVATVVYLPYALGLIIGHLLGYDGPVGEPLDIWGAGFALIAMGGVAIYIPWMIAGHLLGQVQ